MRIGHALSRKTNWGTRTGSSENVTQYGNPQSKYKPESIEILSTVIPSRAGFLIRRLTQNAHQHTRWAANISPIQQKGTCVYFISSIACNENPKIIIKYFKISFVLGSGLTFRSVIVQGRCSSRQSLLFLLWFHWNKIFGDRTYLQISVSV